jgi:hypothetical protein
MAHRDTLHQFGSAFTFLSINNQILAVANVNIRNSVANIHETIRFRFCDFFVRKNLNPYMNTKIDSKNTNIANIKVTTFDINTLISLGSIPNDWKKLTSSTLFAFKTTNAINVPHKIKNKNATIQINFSIFLKDAF